MDSINFTANFIKNVNINKLNKENKYSPYKASLIELDYQNENDIAAISKTVSDWEDSLTFFAAADMKNAQRGKITDPFKVYALTTQKSKFDNINPEKILGVVEVSDKKTETGRDKIEIFQTNPEYNYDFRFASNSKFKNIGKKLMKHIQQEHNSLYTYPVKSAVRFYEKMGFLKKENFQQTNYMYFDK